MPDLPLGQHVHSAADGIACLECQRLWDDGDFDQHPEPAEPFGYPCVVTGCPCRMLVG